MAKKALMTWVAAARRWTKKYRGSMHAVSCRQLGRPETRDGSLDAANAWWEARRAELESAPPSEEDLRVNAFKVWSMVQDWGRLDEPSRERLVDALLGAGQYAKVRARAAAVVEQAVKAPPAGRTVGEQAAEWGAFLRSACAAGQMSEGRYDAYVRNVAVFTGWAGDGLPIDAVDEARLEGYFTHLSVQVAARKYSPSYAHTLLMTARQFISRMAELKLIPLPGNIRSRRLRFNHSAPAKVETFSKEEVRAMLAACDGFSGRTKLYLLLMLNCGMYQNDVAELLKEEVDWPKGALSRSRSKTKERRGPVVTYALWPETLALLRKHRAAEGDLALTTDEGKPLVRYWLEGGKMRRYDVVQSAWSRLARRMGLAKMRLGMKHLRKTAATLLAAHPQYKYYAGHYLADSPKGMDQKHYVRPSEAEFALALGWLRGELLGAEGG